MTACTALTVSAQFIDANGDPAVLDGLAREREIIVKNLVGNAPHIHDAGNGQRYITPEIFGPTYEFLNESVVG